jgi:hypothetical protein
MCTSKSLDTYELKTICWASNHQNIYRNGVKAHFPFTKNHDHSVALPYIDKLHDIYIYI